MFYSQFILAKKGPLGTIWIAAHLERKLRKNQVADTDIGVSVDSILFPDVPIALRLSSHLLLGVVRIYNRKVNYLFDDCSEALLKIKQAFRSTAVDLPPEESKAPYHSITLPETFDLDDFELPDNDIFQGNYVDHHVSSREQITLQDNMEGVVYSTSQFGLDERFGDGETSGLDLDEELLMGRVHAAGHSGLSDPQASVHSLTPLKQDEHDEGMPANIEIQYEVVCGDADLMDYAQAPSTPGLIEEPNLSKVQETSACDDHMESEYNHTTQSAVKENLENTSSKLDHHQGNEHMVDWSMPNDTASDAAPCIPCEENGYHSSDWGIPTEVTIEHISSDDRVAVSGHPFVAEVGVTGEKPKLADKSDGAGMSHENCGELIEVISEGRAEGASNLAEKSCNMENAENCERLSSPRDGLELGAEFQDTSDLENPESRACEEPKDSLISNLVLHDKFPCNQVQILRPCNANLGELDCALAEAEHSVDLEPSDKAAVPLETSERLEVLQTSGDSTVLQGEKCNSVVDSELILKENHMIEPGSLEDIRAGSGKLDDQGNNVIQGDSPLDNGNYSVGIDFPAPEKMLSVPDGFGNQPRNLLVEATPGNLAGIDESDAGSRIVSRKKRSYTESTLTEQSLNSVESSRAVRTKITVEAAVPDDDDLLSSILVGRRSSVLKVKPTPPPSEITSLKRHRAAPRISTFKRKVPMDDTMVLHGDTIRQQLMNTEDIRRFRKKAPCTRPEIAMIQKQFLEDEIFGESIFSGVSIYVASLHNQRYDLSGIIVYHDEVSDEKAENFGDGNDLYSSAQKVVENNMDGGGELTAVRENVEIQTAENCELNDHKIGEDCNPNVDAKTTEVQMKPTEDLAVTAEPSSLQLEHSQNLAEVEIDGGSFSISGAVDPAFPAVVEPSDRVSGDIGDISVERSEMDAAVQMNETLVSSDEKRVLEFVDVDASLMNGAIGKINDDNELNDNNDDTVKVGDIIASVETEHSTRDGVSLEAMEGDVTVETGRDTNDLGVEYNANGPSIEVETDIGGRRVENDQICDGIGGEQLIVNSSSLAENVTLEASSLHEGKLPMQPEYYLPNVFDVEDMHDRDDLNYSAAANDTEFLNVDDDDVAEVTDDYTPNAEEIRFTENSGWSSRTRAVAKYLQTLFVKEAECGRKALPMDNLLAGKTRKEASRMFFEALVLKTRDYIHVEQEYPFDNIDIKPRTKLVKSDL